MKWSMRVWKQITNYCALAERTEPGKRFCVNAEGSTPEEAVENLKKRLDNLEN